MNPPSIRAFVLLGLLAVAVGLLSGGRAGAIKREPAVEATKYGKAGVLIRARKQNSGEAGSFTGVLLAPRVVLTVAHGVVGFERWEVTAPHVKGGPAQSPVRESQVFPSGQVRHFEEDLAILILEKPIDPGVAFPQPYAGRLLPIDSPLALVGRVSNGTVSAKQLYEAAATRVAFPANTNVYGCLPRTTEPGDSGGPVFVRDEPGVVVGVISGYYSGSRRFVATDLLIPIYSKNVEWIRSRLRAAEREPTRDP